MADTKISALPDAGTLASADVLPLVQGTATHKVSLTQLDSRWVSASSATISGGLTVNPYIAVGTNPAQTGVIRIPSDTWLTARNAANTGDLSLLRTTSTNSTVVNSSNNVALQINGATAILTNMSGTTVAGSVAVGTNPAATGILRLPNNQKITWRNAANDADSPGIWLGNDNLMRIGAVTGTALTLFSGTNTLAIDGSILNSSGPMRLGTNPAQSGIVRLPNDQPIVARNAGNTADVPMLKVSTANKVQTWDGTAWADVGTSGGTVSPEIFSTSLTAPVSVTSTAASTAQTILTSSAVTYDGTAIWLEAFLPFVLSPAVASGQIMFNLWDGAIDLGYWGTLLGNGLASSLVLTRRLVPSVGSHSYALKSWCPTGTPGNVSAGVGGSAGLYGPGFLVARKA